MGWLGKVVGGTIGFAVGGPLGAIAGAAFGHAFDRGNAQDYAPDPAKLSSAETAQFTFFVATFSMLAKLAKTDGQVSKEEVASIEKFMAQDLIDRATTIGSAISSNLDKMTAEERSKYKQVLARELRKVEAGTDHDESLQNVRGKSIDVE